MDNKQRSTWIWYPGDFEVWLGNIFNNRRTERGAMFPPFWKQDSHYPTVEFTTTVELEEPEEISITTEGQYNLSVDGKLQTIANIPAGHHRLSIKVWNQATPPALFVCGRSIHSDTTWLTTYEDKIWIDENGVAHGSGIYVPVGSWHFDSPDTPPSTYHLECKEQRPISSESITDNGTLYDFGRETFGYLKLTALKGTIRIYYGESREEALDRNHCETLDVLSAAATGVPVPPFSAAGAPVPFSSSAAGSRHPGDALSTPPLVRCDSIVAPSSKAFRFVYIEKEDCATYGDVLMDYEYAPHNLQHSGSFRCSDEELNRIWDVAAYTMDLTTREFFMDGIKRDRWTWSGDAIQSYLMNYYLRFDSECVKRTIRQLRGKDPVTAHVNTIMDYTFYWFKSILDYYQYTGDVAFVKEMWPRMVTLMDYVLSRTNTDGMAEGQPDDWIFVDWVDFPMHKRGTLCFEQLLLCKALETMATCATIVQSDSINSTQAVSARSVSRHTQTVPARSVSRHTMTTDLPDYAALAATLRANINTTFWDDSRHAYLHAIEEGTLNTQITKFPNMFAILYGLCETDKQATIMQHVMLNTDIDPITTPYMRFYELETLCMGGLHQQVLKEMKDYWGGMLREGATTFWEKYIPTENGTQHLAMYGRPYGKSLCHAWGASPIYLIGKYFLGVKPTEPGYKKFEVRPYLGDLEWIEGSVPTPHGMIHIHLDRHSVSISTTEGEGTLFIDGREVSITPNQPLRLLR